jgi:hypothetical protein
MNISLAACNKSIKQKSGIYVLFAILIILNFLVESMLQTQAGVIFYVFFISLFLLSERANLNQLK